MENQKTILQIFSRALGREAHVLSQHPDLLWQQLFNRLQWEGEEVQRAIATEFALRSAPERAPWVHTKTPLWESGALLRTLSGHTGSVTGCDFSPDGKWLVTASADKTLRIWDAARGDVLRTLAGHAGAIQACAFSSDGRLIVSTSADQTLRIWEAATGRVLHTFEGPSGAINVFALSPDGRWVASAYHKSNLSYIIQESNICIWDVFTGSRLQTLEGHTGNVLACAFSPDGRSVVSSSQDRTVRIWDTLTGALLKTFKAPSKLSEEEIFIQTQVSDDPDFYYDAVWSCVFSPDGRTIAAGGRGRAVFAWDLITAEQLHVLGGHTDDITSCAFSPDGMYLASSSKDHTVCFYNAVSGELLGVLEGHTSEVTHCKFSPDGSLIASADNIGKVRLWDTKKIQQGSRKLIGHQGGVMDCHFSPDGSIIASVGMDNQLQTCCTATGKKLHSLEGGQSDLEEDRFYMLTVSELERYRDVICSCSFSPIEPIIVTGGTDQTLRLWHSLRGDLLDVMADHEINTTGCRFSLDGHWILCWQAHILENAGYFYSSIWVWDAHTKQRMHTIPRKDNFRVIAPVPSPDSRFLAYADGQILQLWDFATGQVRSIEVHPAAINALRFSPDGHRIVSISDDKKGRIWDIETGEILHVLDGITDCVFSPDGDLIACCGDDGIVRVWQTKYGHLFHTMHGKVGRVSALRFSPDGNWVVSASLDSTVRVWHVKTGDLVERLPLVGRPVSLELHPSKPIMICGDTSGTLYLGRLVGIAYGPMIVTASGNISDSVVRCPYCQTHHAITQSQLGTELTCPTPGCGLQLKVNPFVLDTTAWPG